ncbi:MAG: SpoIIE family protein phosphatase [Lachnospiraceae bacterium]|nr:SpoIIE family protein phosphatase [Lachnospiraceae bacterium]
MKGKEPLIPKGFAGKIIKTFIFFALTMGAVYLAVFALQLSALHRKIRADEETQLSVTAGRSEESMTVIAEENLIALIKWASDRTDDEFWIAAHDLKILRRQVSDIYRNPRFFGRRPVSPARPENAGKPALQLLSPGDYEKITPDELDMIERLANLEPMLRESLIKSDFNVDVGIATMDGLCLDMDRLSEKKIMEDGRPISLDVRDQTWYTGAVERGDVFFYPIHSLIYDFDEVAYATPVYVDNELVAVLEGSIQMDLLRSFLEDRDLGDSGFTVLISDKGQLACSSRASGELKSPEDYAPDIRESVNPGLREAINKGLSGETGVTRLMVDGEEYYAAYGYMRSCGWIQIIFVSVDEVMDPAHVLLEEMREISHQDIIEQEIGFRRSGIFAFTVFMIILGIGIVVVSGVARRNARPIALMAERVGGIAEDNIRFEMDESYKTGDEIQILAESFSETLNKSKEYVKELLAITSEKERVNTELSLATRIQADMLPSRFPAFPDRTEFNIYASMTPAKEVGGDFYDFFFTGDDRLAMVIADVSGKGVPAALFMMMVRTMIQNRLIDNMDVARVLEDVNNAICANNREKMFVTVWLGILDLESGVLEAANAGHEYPMVKEPGGRFEIIKNKHGFIIGGKENMKYTGYQILMKPGSKLLVYTDGVPEAMNEEGKLFGRERMLQAVNGAADLKPEDIIANVSGEVKKYMGSAEQVDDVTMLCMEYYGKSSGEQADEE